jgi:tripartite-type tricarboxylate transporter receptor subunit TctC
MKAYGVSQKDKMPGFPQADSFVTMFGPKLAIDYWQAMFAPAGRRTQ